MSTRPASGIAVEAAAYTKGVSVRQSKPDKLVLNLLG